MRAKTLLLAALLCASAARAADAKVAPPPPQEKRLGRISADGKVIAATWTAAAVAHRQLRKRQGYDRTRAALWVTVPHAGGWLTVFGRTQRDQFQPAWAYWSDLQFEQLREVELADVPDVAREARAVERARRKVGAATELGPLAPIVVGSEEELTVYLIQEPREQGVFVMGGDHRLRFDREGKLLEHRKLHRGAVVVPRPSEPPPEGEVPSLFHNHVVGMDPLPTETDVVFAIIHGVELEVYAPTGRVYRISPQGEIAAEQGKAPARK